MNKSVLTRPAIEHPNLNYWLRLKELKRTERKKECNGVIRCSGCSSIEAQENIFELHHLHYDNFGSEELSDVNLFCKYCHEALTLSIRERVRKAEILEAEKLKLDAQQLPKQVVDEKNKLNGGNFIARDECNFPF